MEPPDFQRTSFSFRKLCLDWRDRLIENRHLVPRQLVVARCRQVLCLGEKLGHRHQEWRLLRRRLLFVFPAGLSDNTDFWRRQTSVRDSVLVLAAVSEFDASCCGLQVGEVVEEAVLRVPPLQVHGVEPLLEEVAALPEVEEKVEAEGPEAVEVAGDVEGRVARESFLHHRRCQFHIRRR